MGHAKKSTPHRLIAGKFFNIMKAFLCTADPHVRILCWSKAPQTTACSPLSFKAFFMTSPINSESGLFYWISDPNNPFFLISQVLLKAGGNSADSVKAEASLTVFETQQVESTGTKSRLRKQRNGL